MTENEYVVDRMNKQFSFAELSPNVRSNARKRPFNPTSIETNVILSPNPASAPTMLSQRIVQFNADWNKQFPFAELSPNVRSNAQTTVQSNVD